MVKAVVLDMDGVIRHLDVEYAERVAQTIGFSLDELMDLLWDNDAAQELLCGRSTPDVWWEQVQKLDVRLEGVSQDLIWDEVLVKSFIDRDVIEFIGGVSGHLVTCILSNCTKEGKIKILRDIGEDSPFDFILSSSDFGATKPAPEVYHGMLETIGVKAEDCILFDDRPPNVDGAKAVGIQAYLFEGIEQLKKLVIPS